MEAAFKKTSGYCLIIASFLMMVTMMLHPVGGNAAHILKIKTVIMVSHSMAIVCLPVTAFGFWGLATSLDSRSRISYLALSFSWLGLVAAMIAATINGLTLPLFLSNTGTDIDPKTIELVRTYGAAINKPMSYSFIAAMVVSIAIWSLLQIRKHSGVRWIGYYGIGLMVAALAGSVFQFSFVSLYGFTVFVISMVVWIVLSGITLVVSSPRSSNNNA